MKMILLITGFSIVLFSTDTESKHQVRKSGYAASQRNDPVDFSTQVKPLLQKKCSPCHFEGGKMYAKMPFDDSTTIIRHETGVLKRFKDEQEIALIKKMILQNSKMN